MNSVFPFPFLFLAKICFGPRKEGLESLNVSALLSHRQFWVPVPVKVGYRWLQDRLGRVFRVKVPEHAGSVASDELASCVA